MFILSSTFKFTIKEFNQNILQSLTFTSPNQFDSICQLRETCWSIVDEINWLIWRSQVRIPAQHFFLKNLEAFSEKWKWKNNNGPVFFGGFDRTETGNGFGADPSKSESDTKGRMDESEAHSVFFSNRCWWPPGSARFGGRRYLFIETLIVGSIIFFASAGYQWCFVDFNTTYNVH